MAIWGHSLCLPIYSPAFVLRGNLLRPALTRTLNRWIGWRPTRDGDVKHLKLVAETARRRRRLQAGYTFCARLTSSTLRRAAAHPLCAVIGCGRRSLSTRGFRSADLSLTLVSVAHMYHFVCSPCRAHERALYVLRCTMYFYILSELTCEILWVALYDASSPGDRDKINYRVPMRNRLFC